ncbi:MAG: GspE/PulE family protein [Candidatus Margulisiibacteriota bacterium]
MATHRLIQACLSNGLVSAQTLEGFSEVSAQSLLTQLRTTHQLPDAVLMPLLSAEFGFAQKALTELLCDPKLRQNFQDEDLRRERFIPVYETPTVLCLATDNPFNPYFQTLAHPEQVVQLYLVSSSELDAQFSATQSSPSRLWQVVGEAIDKEASDLHLYSTAEGLSVVFRIHGNLVFQTTVPTDQKNEWVSLLKYEAGMDISISTKPQDGRLSITHNNLVYDVRISALPTIHGEDFVLRFFKHLYQDTPLEQLGFSDPAKTLIEAMLTHKSGLILVTGATGAGKSTTVYSLLSHLLKTRTSNIITLEDPVEALIPGIRQSQINPESGYTFAQGLRASLRQDPDVILIGEIRDRETAAIAIEAAYTGHLVLSTLHTPSPQATLMRLAQFNLDSFLLLNCLKGIVSQHLVPTATGTGGRTVISDLRYVAQPNPNTTLDDWLTQAKTHSLKHDVTDKVNRGLISDATAKSILLGASS